MAVLNCGCGRKLSVSEALAGKKVRCPGCKAVLEVPAAVAPAAPASTHVGCTTCGQRIRVPALRKRPFVLCPKCGANVKLNEAGDTATAPVERPAAPRRSFQLRHESRPAVAAQAEAAMESSGRFCIAAGIVFGIGFLLPIASTPERSFFVWDLFSESRALGRLSELGIAIYVMIFYPLIGCLFGFLSAKIPSPFIRGSLLIFLGVLPAILVGVLSVTLIPGMSRRTGVMEFYMVAGGFSLFMLASALSAVVQGGRVTTAQKATIAVMAGGAMFLFFFPRMEHFDRVNSWGMVSMGGAAIGGILLIVAGVTGGDGVLTVGGFVGPVFVCGGALLFMIEVLNAAGSLVAGMMLNFAVRIFMPSLFVYAGGLALFVEMLHPPPSEPPPPPPDW